jgi:hypothetical protein
LAEVVANDLLSGFLELQERVSRELRRNALVKAV